MFIYILVLLFISIFILYINIYARRHDAVADVRSVT